MHDLIYCFRMLRKRPSFTIVAVLTLALAIGASTALFSIVNVVVLNPFPYKDPSRLYFVRQSLPKIGVQEQFRASGPEFLDLAKSGIFERVAAFETVSRNLTGSDEPERVAAAKCRLTSSTCSAWNPCSAARSPPTNKVQTDRECW